MYRYSNPKRTFNINLVRILVELCGFKLMSINHVDFRYYIGTIICIIPPPSSVDGFAPVSAERQFNVRKMPDTSVATRRSATKLKVVYPTRPSWNTYALPTHRSIQHSARRVLTETCCIANILVDHLSLYSALICPLAEL